MHRGSAAQAQYFELYVATAAALKRVNGSLRVGGPATSGGAWLPEFLAFAAARGAPVDFVSVHHYPTDVAGGLDVDALSELVQQSRAQVPAAVPLVLSEFNSGLFYWQQNNDEDYASAFLVHSLPSASLAAALDIASYWAFSDIFEELGFDSTPFHDGYGLLTVQGVAKPAYRAMQLLHEAGNELLPVNSSSAADDASEESPVRVAATSLSNGDVHVLLSNFQSPLQFNGSWTVTVQLDNFDTSSPATATLRRIDGDNANAKAAWLRMGSPAVLSASQLAALHNASMVRTEPLAVAGSPPVFTVDLPRMGVACVVVSAARRSNPS